MKLNILSLDEKLQKAISILSEQYNFGICENGIKIEYVKVEDDKVSAKMMDNTLVIKSRLMSGFFKALSEYIRTQKDYEAKLVFNKLGLMIDNSRNGVTNVEYTKYLIRTAAFMGHNTMYLYLEDTYLLDNHPYFGYLRGGYTREELKQLDDYADIFGIEIVPCIQTLAHIQQFFMWEHISREYADIDDVLCVGQENTLTLIEDMIKHFSNTLRTRRIHLGMDEAYNLGRGRYANLHGLKDKPQIMLQHLNDLLAICKKYGMEPMIWDDMFFMNYSKLKEGEEFSIPDGIGLMYWDYYNSSEDHYIQRIRMRKQISKEVLFAGGAWRWVGYTPHHSKSIITLEASLSAALKENISEVLITSWADDGTESPVFNTMLGALVASELSFGSKEYKEKCVFYLGIDFDDFMSVEKLDRVEGTDKDQTPSKYMFYEDALMSKFVYHNERVEDDLTKIYHNLHIQYSDMAKKYSNVELLKAYFEFYCAYTKILEYKWNLGLNIYMAYQKKDKEAIEAEIGKINTIVPLLTKFQKRRKKLWFMENKRYGFEIIEQRIGGLMLRLQSIKDDLENFVENDYVIEELEEKRIALEPNFEGKGYIHYNRALRAISASRMTW